MAQKKKKKKSRPKDEIEWSIEDFVGEVSALMAEQELENPRMVRVHERLSPEFKETTDLIVKLVQAEGEAEEEKAIDELIACGEQALLPLIEFIRTLKKHGTEGT